MMYPDFFSRNRLLMLHLSFWALYFTYRIYDVQIYVGYYKALVYVGFPLFFNLVASYIHYFFVFPMFLLTKKTGTYLMKLILLLGLVVAIRIFMENIVMPQFIPREKYYETIALSRIISTVWDTSSFLIFTGMLRLTTDWFDFENKKKELENQKLNAELNYLKAQINPHFLFNTLHNLNYLVYAKSDKATEVIIKLSNIMRYMIYDANKDKVALSKEISYIENYIDLEKLRINNPVKIKFEIKGDTNAVTIAPLILLTFIENAFKHGVSDQQPGCDIEANLIIEEDKLICKVSNGKIKPPQTEKSGFGLENVKQRLELIYPNLYTLVIEDKPDLYTTNLMIKHTLCVA